MNIHTQTSIEIDFSRGQEITPVIVFDGVEQESQTFNNKTHQIEELLDYIAYNENGGCDVYLQEITTKKVASYKDISYL